MEREPNHDEKIKAAAKSLIDEEEQAHDKTKILEVGRWIIDQFEKQQHREIEDTVVWIFISNQKKSVFWLEPSPKFQHCTCDLETHLICDHICFFKISDHYAWIF